MKAFQIETGILRLEEDLSAAETLVADQDFSAVRKFIVLFARVALFSFFHGSVVVRNNVANTLLNIADNFVLSWRSERQTTFLKNLLQVFSKVLACQLNALNCRRNGITFINGDSMGNALTRVEHCTSGLTAGIE